MQNKAKERTQGSCTLSPMLVLIQSLKWKTTSCGKKFKEYIRCNWAQEKGCPERLLLSLCQHWNRDVIAANKSTFVSQTHLGNRRYFLREGRKLQVNNVRFYLLQIWIPINYLIFARKPYVTNLSQKTVYSLPVTLNSQWHIPKPLEIQPAKGFWNLFIFTCCKQIYLIRKTCVEF